MRSVSNLAFLFFALTALSNAQAANPIINDSDLGGPPHRKFHSLSSEITPDKIQTAPGDAPLVLTVTRIDHGRPTPVSDLTFVVASPNGSIRLTTDDRGSVRLPELRCSRFQLSAELTNEHFEIENGDDQHVFKLIADVPCSGTANLIFNSDTNSGQAIGIWQSAVRARAALRASIGLDFWHSRTTFLWPAEGDFYSGGVVNLTRGDHWDVVTHELGHAIYDLGGLGRFGGGPHKIDECYSKELALSEGWASFFSGWVNVNLADPDAKFEYMVPRRAPIRFENIPADVCHGETNEWRVTGFFWDLVDTHDDGETMKEGFARLWNILKGSRVSSASEALARMEKAGLDKAGLRRVWSLNF